MIRGYININEVTYMELKPKDQVICLHSRVKGRTGKIFTIKRGPISTKDISNDKVDKKFLEFLRSYGDRFKKINLD